MRKSLLLILFYVLSLLVKAQTNPFEELLSSSTTSKDSLEIIQQYLSELSKTSDEETTGENIQKIEFSLTMQENDELNALFFEKKAVYNRRIGNIEEAIDSYDEAEVFYLKLKDNQSLSRLYFSHSKAHTSNYDFKQALDLCFMSLEIANTIDDKEAQGRALIQIGINYDYQNNYKEAIVYYQKALAVYLVIESEKGMSNAYNNIGVMYDLMGDIDSAFFYYQKSLDIDILLNNKLGIAGSNVNIALIHQIEGNYAKAEELYYIALDMYLELNDDFGVAICYVNLAEFYMELEKYDKAISYARKSMELSSSAGDMRQLIDNYEKLISIYESAQMYKTAFLTQKEMLSLKDSVLKYISDKEIEILKLRLKGVKEDKISLTLMVEEEKKKAKELEIRNQQTVAFGMIGFLLVIGVGLFYSQIKSRK